MIFGFAFSYFLLWQSCLWWQGINLEYAISRKSQFTPLYLAYDVLTGTFPQMLACPRCRGVDTHVLTFSSLSRDSRLGMAIRVRISGHPRVLARWVRVQFYTRGLHPHTTRTETGLSAGLVLHPRVTRRVTEKSPTVFFTCHPAVRTS
jgi:hypothetical protein